MTFLDDVLAAKTREIATLQRSPRLRARTPRPAFAHALTGRRLSVIAEIKRRSPSRGVLAPNLKARSLALAYARGGASAISCLTDREFFGAQPEDFADARGAGLPVLRKDFILAEAQVEESADMGASAILLIARILEASRLQSLHAHALSLGLDVLVEAHDERDIDAALAAGASIVGINNRDLETLEVDRRLAPKLRRRVPGGILTVAESGLRTRDDLAAMEDAGFDAALIGETVATHDDPAACLLALRAPRAVLA